MLRFEKSFQIRICGGLIYVFDLLNLNFETIRKFLILIFLGVTELQRLLAEGTTTRLLQERHRCSADDRRKRQLLV